MPRAMFWIALIYVVIATIVAFWIGRPIIRLSFDNEKYNAAFRYALVRLRDASESVAFYRGELAERMQLRSRFAPVVTNYRRFINRTDRFLRLEPVDQPDHHPATLGHPGPATVHR